MVSVGDAIDLILDNTKRLDSVRVSTQDSRGLVLSENIISSLNLPIFDNSAVDGYAVKSADANLASADSRISLNIVGTIRAGDFPEFSINTGEAAKIMTGAAMPVGADSVVKIEDVVESDGSVILSDKVVNSANVRFEGEEIRTGEIALESGLEVTAATLGFISEFGIKEVDVYRPPRISLIVSGEELVDPYEDLSPGKIRDTNTITLRAAIAKESTDIVSAKRVIDDRSVIDETIGSELDECDILLTTGGVSVGEYDFVKDVLAAHGVEQIFWGISQRPGGPLYFGKKGNKLVFGLPGNPASALVCYYEYVIPAIRKMAGKKQLLLIEEEAQLTETINKKAGKQHFMRGVYSRENGKNYVRTAGEQGSHMMKSFAMSNCLIVLGEEVTCLPKDTNVKIHLLP